jgi:predicted transcriptional regulator
MALPFLVKLQEIFSPDSVPKNKLETEKKKLLKMTVRDMAQCRYKKFYKVKTDEIDVDLGQFLYNIYKLIVPAQTYVMKAASSSQVKNLVMESFLEKKVFEASLQLTAESIEDRAKTVTPQQLSEQVKEDMELLFAVFTGDIIRQANDTYNTILRFINFVNFNYYDILKRFDANMPERSPTYQPQFNNVLGERLSEDLKDFMEVAYAMDKSLDWKRVIKILNTYKDAEVMSEDLWYKMLGRLQDVQNSSVFLLIVRLVDKNPVWQVKANIPSEHIAESWLEERRLEAQKAIEKVVNAKKNAAIAVLAKGIFGEKDFSRMKYYTAAANEIYVKKNLEGFTHIGELSYLKGFIIDIFKKDIFDLCNLVLVKGQWKNQQLSHQMSDAVHQLDAIADKIAAFDSSFADSGEYGVRLRVIAAKVDKEKSQVRYANNIFKIVNNTAQNIINSSAQALIILGKYSKTLIDDKQKTPHEFIMNWKELEVSSDVDLSSKLEDSYKKIYGIVKLLQTFNKPMDAEQ